jgi:hypothetical protein
MEDKIATSIKVSSELWQEFKIYCIRQKKEMSELITELIIKEMKKENGRK